jgi:hypothetical protein
MNSDNYDLRSGDWVAGIIAGERQRELICFPPQKASRIVTVYRDQGIAYFPARLGAREGRGARLVLAPSWVRRSP